MLALPEGRVARRWQPPSPVLVGVVAAILISIFVADLLTPLGYSIWVLYIGAVGVAIVGARASIPILASAVASLFTVVGFVLSPPGEPPILLTALNRTSGVVVLWVIGILGFQFLRLKAQLERRNWLQTGRARLQEAMQGGQALEGLGRNVLVELCRTLDVPVAALHVAEGSGLRRIASLGVDPKAAASRIHAVGDGLVGRAALEQRTLRIRDLPPRYLPIASGLGGAEPAELVLLPLVDDGELRGVLELALLRRLEDDELELIETMAEPISIELSAAVARARLQELLEETQRQAEELQAQQEELEAANEELESHTRALKESQDRLAAHHAELERSNANLEEQKKLLESQRDALRRAQADLQAKAAELERTNRFKSQFLANMSHELRTPLNSALILSRLLADNREGRLTAEQVKYAETIHAAGNDLLELINDVLDLAKIEAGRLELRVEEVAPASLVADLRAAFEPMARQKGLDFRVEAAGAGAALRTDRMRVEQILRNLLSNAIKFTDRGYVRLEVERRGDRIAFVVEDTGIGIAAEAQEGIFEAFRQADGSTSRKYGGTGLGLAIARDLAERLGGSLELRSERDRGSAFTLSLPLALEAPAEVSEQAQEMPQQGREKPSVAQQALAEEAGTQELAPVPGPAPGVEDDREKIGPNARAVLIIEDDVPFASLLRDLARELRFDALIATTADEGLQLARRFTPAAIVLDLALPDHNGLTVLDQLKRDGATRHIPVHVVSAMDHTIDALSMGAVGYVRKPTERDELVRAFEGLERQLENRVRRVLVVEDDPRQREAIRALLASAGIETACADGVSHALGHLHEGPFDCIVADLRLADGDGFEFLEGLLDATGGRPPPVIVHTGKELEPGEEARLRRHSDSIIVKGARSPERLLDEVTLFLHQVESRLPAELQRMLHASRNRESAFEGRRILVVEDDIRNVFALTSILEPRGARLEVARDGIEALEALERNEAIDLVLMDIMMPRMDGLEAIARIRKEPNRARLPIIALTAKAMPDDQARCLAAGANDYATKPIEVEKLLSLMRVWLPRRSP